MVRESDIYNFVIALSGMGIIMFWRKNPKDQPHREGGASEDDSQYRWDDGKWRVPSYEHWYASNTDYQTDERNYWWHQVRALWASIAVGIATLIAAVSAGVIAYWAYEATSAAVVEAQKQTVEAQNQTAQAMRQADYAQQALKLTRDQFVQDSRPYIWLTTGLEQPQLIGTQIAWNWQFSNYGKAPAHEVRAKAFLKIEDGAFVMSYGTSEITITGNPIPPNVPFKRTAVSEPGITPEQWARIHTSSNAVQMSGLIQYSDAFGNSYETFFCIGLLSTGAIMHEPPAENCRNEMK